MSNDKIKSRKLRHSEEEAQQEKVVSKNITLDDVLNTVEASRKKAIDRKVALKSKSLKGRKITVKDVDKKEKKLDKEIEKEDNLSIAIIVLILLACFVVGGVLGYMLYRIAINSSNVLLIVQYFFQ